MNPNQIDGTRAFRPLRSVLLGTFALVLIALASAGPAAAQTCGNGSVEGLEECDDSNTVSGDGCSQFCLNEATNCLNDFAMFNNPTCTAKDVKIALIINASQAVCEVGTLVELNLLGRLEAGSDERYDIGTWIARDGGSAKFGTCDHDFLNPVTDTFAQVCSISKTACASDGDCPILGEQCLGTNYNPGGPSPPYSCIGNEFVTADGSFCAGIDFHDGEQAQDAADVCGDLEQGVDAFFDLGQIVLPCVDSDDDGRIDIGTCVSWENNPNTVASQCRGVDDAIPGTPSKCRCETQNIGNVFVGATIVVVKETDPDGDPTSFDIEVSENTSPTATVLDTFMLSDGQSGQVGNLLPSELSETTYSAAETVPAGWDLTDVTCVSDLGNSVPDETAISLESGETVTCTFTNTKRGSITIVKDAQPNDATDFGYTTTSGPDTSLPASFSLDDDADATLPNSRTFSDLKPGSYSVTEDDPTPGFDLSNLVCSDGSTTSVATRTASIDLAAGESVTCTFTNTKRGSITIVKDAVPDDATDFGYTTTSGPDTSLPASFSLDDDADGTLPNSRTFSNLKPGSYSVTEDDPTPGFDLTNLVCSDGSTTSVATRTASIDLAAGESVTCTFTNTKRGSITIVKDAVPDDATDFGYTTTSGPDTSLPASFSLDDDADGTLPNTRTFSNLKPGSYSVTEDDPTPGFDLTNLVCDDANSTESVASRTASIELEAGESVTCTFTNTKRGSITIVKDAVPDDATDFGYTTTSGPDTSLPASFSLDDDADGTLPNSRTFSNLKPGSYSVTEDDPTPAFDLTNLVCDDANSTESVASRTASIELEAGESVTCTFTNTKRGSITIVKDAVPDDATDFRYTTTSGPDTSLPASFSLDDDADPTLPNSRTFSNLKPGSYSVTENDPTPVFDLTNLVCSDGSTTSVATRTASIDLAAGESVTCTFTNTKRGSIVIVKDAVPDDPTDFGYTTASGTDTPLAATFSLDDDADGTLSNMVVFNNLKPGSYSVTEDDPLPSFDLTALSCNDANSVEVLASRTANIVLDPGETVTCTFTNTKRAMVSIAKTESGGVPLSDLLLSTLGFDIRVGADATTSAGTVVANGVIDPVTGQVTFTCAGGSDPTCVNDGSSMAKLVPGTYQLCETGMMPGWSNNIPSPPGFTPLGATPEGGDNSEECVELTLAAGATGVPATVPDPIDNTPPPGGDARTIGFWKNWTSCDGKGNQDPVLDDNLGAGILLWSGYLVDTCEVAVDLLDKRMVENPALVGDGSKSANDAAYGLSAQLLAALLNIEAAAGTCPDLFTAIGAAQDLLERIGFDGQGSYLTPNPNQSDLLGDPDPDGGTFNRKKLRDLRQLGEELAGILDAYNNNLLCP